MKEEYDHNILEYMFGGGSDLKKCLNCGEQFDPTVASASYYTCSVECGAEAARILNEQRPLSPE